MNRLLFVFLLAADPKSAADAFAAAKGVSPLSTSLATSTSSSLSSRRPRAEVSTATRNRQHQPDSSNIIQEYARGVKRRKILKASTMGALGFMAVASRSSVANAARKAASAAVVPVLELPSTKTLALACLVPTLLGYYKSGNNSDWLDILIVASISPSLHCQNME